MNLINIQLYQLAFQNTGDAAQLCVLQHTFDGFGAIQHLKLLYKRVSWQYQQGLLYKLDELKIPSCANPREAVQALTDLIGRLHAKQIDFKEKIMQAKILDKMCSKSYKPLKSQFEGKLQERKEPLTPFICYSKSRHTG